MRSLKSVTTESEGMEALPTVFTMKGSRDKDASQEPIKRIISGKDWSREFEVVYDGSQDQTPRTFTVEKTYDTNDIGFTGEVKEIRLKEGDVEIVSHVGDCVDMESKIDAYFKGMDIFGFEYDKIVKNLTKV